MFEWLESLAIRRGGGEGGRGSARSRQTIPSSPITFPGHPLLPGSLQIELCAQVAGPLVEELVARRHGAERFAFLGMVRNATFHAPVALPATLGIFARAARVERDSAVVHAELTHAIDAVDCRVELVMVLRPRRARMGGRDPRVPRAHRGPESAGAAVTHVVIIGAGPAGLASAACLARRGIAYTLLERGSAPAAGLRRVDPAMRLFSPARLSRLPGMETAWLGATYPSFGQFVAALDRYREALSLAVTTDTQVTAIERDADGFAVRCTTGGRANTVRGTARHQRHRHRQRAASAR